ncbi:putative transcriptional regulatory protein NarL [Coriobacteriaceae bacterium CHKCI002]|nr:putative transcriptional regulatory protein NarL [Coriobacteriaceae bacterium CHKCI002]
MKEGILQKVRHELSAVLSSEGTLAQAVGLAFFFAWNLTDIYADPFIGSGEMMSEPMRLHVVSSLCNACGYLIAMLLFSRSGSFRGIVCGSSGLAGAATVGLYALSAWGWMEAQTALLLYRGVTRLCSACVVVAWGMCYSRLEPHELTMRALMAFVFAALGYLLLDALAGATRVVLLGALLPLSALLLCMSVREGGGPSLRSVGAEGTTRLFLSQVWRVLVILLLMGVIAWTVIIGTQQRQALGPQGGSYVAVVSLVVAAVLLMLAVSCRGVLSYSSIYKIVLPLVMTGLLFAGSFSLTMGVGFTLVSVGYTCLDLFCFVMIANACWRTGMRAVLAFGWYRALECSVPLLSLAVLRAVESLGVARGDSFLNSFSVACALAIAVSFLLDRRGVIEHGGHAARTEYPKTEILQFAAQCEEAVERYKLTERESEVLGLVVRGRNIPHISKRLHISKTTTKTHVAHIYQKFGVSDRQEMIDLIETMETSDRKGA